MNEETVKTNTMPMSIEEAEQIAALKAMKGETRKQRLHGPEAMLKDFFMGARTCLNRADLRKAMDRGEEFGHKFNKWEKLCMKYAWEMSFRMGDMVSLMTEFCDLERKTHNMLMDFKTQKDFDHAHEALCALEAKMEIINLKRREITGEY